MRSCASTRPAVSHWWSSDGIEAPGGLLLGLDGSSIVQGYGDGFATGALGNVVGLAGLLRIDTASGEQSTIATGTSMSNGLARDPAGVIYASDDVGTGIDRIVGERVQRNWATVISGNGLAVSANGRYLFVNQTFQPAAIQRIDLTEPTRVEHYAAPGPLDFAAGLDGLTIDQKDRLFAAANASGEVWRIDTNGTICAIARGLNQPSAVGFGTGGAFPETSLYAVTFGGDVVEIPKARPAPKANGGRKARLLLRIRPRVLRVGVRKQVTVTVRRGRALEPLARVRIGKKVKRTHADGRVRVFIKRKRAGFVRVHARAAGVPPVRGRVRVLPQTPRPQAIVEP